MMMITCSCYASVMSISFTVGIDLFNSFDADEEEEEIIY